jgi:hypothetical protein
MAEEHKWQHYDGISRFGAKEYAPTKIVPSKLQPFRPIKKHIVN